ncbi:MAG: glycosyltransferase [Candidatus Omnitrophica bacterium]|nr:glycosyltransferase [Candidatus Omnitrophota bacterium]
MAVLRARVDAAHEPFIYRELDDLEGYVPFLLCEHVIMSHGLKLRVHCQRMRRVLLHGNHFPMVPPSEYPSLQSLLKMAHTKAMLAEFLRDAIPYLLFAKKSGIPLISFYRGFELSDPRVCAMLPTLSAVCCKVIARSIFQKKELVRAGFPARKIVVEYGGIDLAQLPFQPRAFERGSLRILAAGRFVEKKGFDLVLDVAEKVKSWRTGARVTVIGDGALADWIKAQVIERKLQDIVTIKLFMPQRAFYAELGQHDIFLFPCRTAENKDREGIPNVLKEAMASGLSVVSTFHAGIPELIEDGASGYLVPENDVQALYKRIEALCSYPARTRKMALRARQTVEERFSIEKSQAGLLKVLNNCL